MEPVSDPGFFRPFNLALFAGSILLLAALNMTIVWVTLSQWRWPIRAAVLMSLVAALALTDATEPAAFLLWHGLFVAVIANWARLAAQRIRDKRMGVPSKTQWRLLDFFLITATVASGLGALRLMKGTFQADISATMLAGATAILALLWLVMGAKLFLLRLLAAGGTVGLYCWSWTTHDWFDWLPGGGGVAVYRPLHVHPRGPIDYAVITIVSLLFVLAWLLLWMRWRHLRGRRIDDGAGNRPSRQEWIFRAAAASVFAVVVLPIATIFVCIALPLPPLGREMPQPNAFDDLWACERRLDGVLYPLKTSPDPAAYPAFAAEHEPAIAKARAALDLPWEFPDEHYLKYEWLGNVFDGFYAMSEARRREGNSDLAADWALASIRFGDQISRKLGSMPLRFFATESLDQLANVSPSLSSKKRVELIASLLKMDANRPTMEELDAVQWHTQPYWYQSEADWRSFFGLQIRTWMGVIRDYDERFILHHFDARLRAAIAVLAVDEFYADHQRYPRDLDELVPGYLADVPIDPFLGEPLIYRPTEKRFVVYSGGYDRIKYGE